MNLFNFLPLFFLVQYQYVTSEVPFLYVHVRVRVWRKEENEGGLARKEMPVKPLLEEGCQPGTPAGWLVTPFQAYGGRKMERKRSLGSNA